MTSLFPHPQYAEDQPSAHAILYLQVLRASAMTFSFLSLPHTGISILSSQVQHQPITVNTVLSKNLSNSGRSLILGAVAGVAMTWGRMRGKSEVEWQDRSWRLLENKGEIYTDWETIGATGVGALAGVAAARRGVVPLSAGRAALGGAGFGLGSGVLFVVGMYVAGRQLR
ncbi:hypothetical protein E8E11_000380 [Didymella keratinophila]|nr:hypothetical protein E8E11_000380 [Didymella keratinophila]